MIDRDRIRHIFYELDVLRRGHFYTHLVGMARFTCSVLDSCSIPNMQRRS